MKVTISDVSDDALYQMEVDLGIGVTQRRRGAKKKCVTSIDAISQASASQQNLDGPGINFHLCLNSDFLHEEITLFMG